MLNLSHNSVRDPENINLPYSKSIANRVIAIFAANGKQIELKENLLNDDILAMQLAVENLLQNQPINAGEAGTVLRFMTALSSAELNFNNKLIGNKRLMERPISPLIESLIELGAKIKQESNTINVEGGPLEGGELNLEEQSSSQFISALLMIGFKMKEGLSLTFPASQASSSYIQLTVDVLKKLNIQVKQQESSIQIKPQINPTLNSIQIERDWSAASFFMCLCMLQPELKMNFTELSLDSNQAEAILCKEWIGLNLLKAANEDAILSLSQGESTHLPSSIDFSNYPDASLNVIICFALLKHSFTAGGLQSLNKKESQRLDLLTNILREMNVEVLILDEGTIQINADHLQLKPTFKFECHNDHRVAFALSLIGLYSKVNLSGSSCVTKSFPYFWDEIQKCGFKIDE